MLENFKPSTKKEIDEFNLSVNDKVEFETDECCPFTREDYMLTTYGDIVELNIQDSSYSLAIYYTDDYGQDKYCSLERALIVQKLKS